MLSQLCPLFLCMLVLSVEFSKSKGDTILQKGSLQVELTLDKSEEQDCPVCPWRKYSKEIRLESIKSQILSKLRLKEAPNITREVVNQLLPKAPPLQQILDQHEFQGDSFQHKTFLEEDEYHATTETVISMAQEIKHRVTGDTPMGYFSLVVGGDGQIHLATIKECGWKQYLLLCRLLQQKVFGAKNNYLSAITVNTSIGDLSLSHNL
ncbi:hypothetical protein XELAEV_18013383mg [Xenopus laevis]|uniref:TGF-beta propeptide domain-containing protein n=1 Tax=Xenopus laevis TaxID=8355 RepID=A0A974DPJ7_XENLA|nr:hypothetical protein XELAEV_18013383mg [Xenopus laevis]